MTVRERVGTGMIAMALAWTVGSPASAQLHIAASGGPACTHAAVLLSCTVEGGTPPYTYAWTPVEDLSDPTVSNPMLLAGSTVDRLSVTVGDALGDTASTTVTITRWPLPRFTVLTASATICSGGSVTLDASAVDGTPPYSFFCHPVGGEPLPGPPFVVAPTSDQAYQFTVTDAHDCRDDSDLVVFVHVIDPVRVTIAGGYYAVGGPGFPLTPTFTPADPPYTFNWSPAEGLSSPLVSNPLAAPTVPTHYYLTMTGAHGCSDTASALVIPGATAFTVSTIDTAICAGGPVTLHPIVTGGTPPMRFFWGPDSFWVGESTFDDPHSPTPTVRPARTTIYTLTVIDSLNISVSVAETVTVGPGVSPAVEATGGTYVPSGSPVHLTLRIWASSPPYTFRWEPSEGLSATDVEAPFARPSHTMSYTVTVTTSEGCSASASALVTVVGPRDSLTVPLASGWNLVAVPTADSATTLAQVFPRAIDAYRYTAEQAYEALAPTSRLEVGAGYWVLEAHDDSAVVAGADTLPIAWPLARGWNLIGGGFGTLTFDAVPGLDTLADPTSAFRYDAPSGSYANVHQIAPGEGLWLRADVAGTLPLPR